MAQHERALHQQGLRSLEEADSQAHYVATSLMIFFPGMKIFG
jgi:hypothetical protein